MAVKRQHKQFDPFASPEEQISCLQSETAALKELHHQNIVEWFHTIETTTDIYMVLEFCSGGDLSDAINEADGLSEDKAKTVFVQVLSAIVYMHSKSMVTTFD